jgi:hypothetical protein
MRGFIICTQYKKSGSSDPAGWDWQGCGMFDVKTRNAYRVLVVKPKGNISCGKNWRDM